MHWLRLALGSLLATSPLLGLSQTASPYPRYYVGIGLYASDYQPFRASYRGLQVPVQAVVGYQLRPRLAVQLGGVTSSIHQQSTGITSYYTSPTGTSGYKTHIYNSSSTSDNTSLSLLARYTLTRQSAHRFQVDALGGLTLEIQHYSDYNTRTEYDSTNTQTAIARNSSDHRSTDALLTAGISPRFRFSRHLDATFDLTFSKNLVATGRGLTGAAALGLRYRFGGLR